MIAQLHLPLTSLNTKVFNLELGQLWWFTCYDMNMRCVCVALRTFLYCEAICSIQTSSVVLLSYGLAQWEAFNWRHNTIVSSVNNLGWQHYKRSLVMMMHEFVDVKHCLILVNCCMMTVLLKICWDYFTVVCTLESGNELWWFLSTVNWAMVSYLPVIYGCNW